MQLKIYFKTYVCVALKKMSVFQVIMCDSCQSVNSKSRSSPLQMSLKATGKVLKKKIVFFKKRNLQMLICQKNNSRDSTSSLNSQQKPEL